MTAALDDPAVVAYLSTLSRLLHDVPDRELVLDGVRHHIDDALDDGSLDPDRVQAVLDDLGDPAVIAAEAGPAARPQVPFLQRRSGAILSVLLLTLGGFIVPVLGWVIGLVLLWTSRGWSVADKLIGTFGPGVLAALLFGLTLALPREVQAHHLALVAGGAIGLVGTAVYLLRRFRERG